MPSRCDILGCARQRCIRRVRKDACIIATNSLISLPSGGLRMSPTAAVPLGRRTRAFAAGQQSLTTRRTASAPVVQLPWQYESAHGVGRGLTIAAPALGQGRAIWPRAGELKATMLRIVLARLRAVEARMTALESQLPPWRSAPDPSFVTVGSALEPARRELGTAAAQREPLFPGVGMRSNDRMHHQRIAIKLLLRGRTGALATSKIEHSTPPFNPVSDRVR